VDYETEAAASVPFGWQVMQAQILGADGVPGVIEASYRISPAVTFDLVQQRVEPKPNPRIVRFAVFLQSNTGKRVDGSLEIEPPEGWRLVSGSGKRFVIYNSRGRVRRVFEMEIPPNVSGAFPIRLGAKMGANTIIQTEWLTVRE
jgi:hypothetical protein